MRSLSIADDVWLPVCVGCMSFGEGLAVIGDWARLPFGLVYLIFVVTLYTFLPNLCLCVVYGEVPYCAHFMY